MSVTMKNDKSPEELSNGTAQSVSISLNTDNAQQNEKPEKWKRVEQCLPKFILSKYNNSYTLTLLFHSLVLTYIAAAVGHWYTNGAYDINWENGLGLLIILSSLYYGFKFLKLISSYVEFDFTYLSKFKVLQHTRSIILGIFFVGFFVFVAIDTQNNRKRLLPILGICLFVAAGYALSKHPSRVNWNTVVSGLALQITIGLLTIRWSSGKYVIQVVGGLVDKFFTYAYIGAEVTYGEELVNTLAVFAFKVLSVIFFMCFVIEILFYYNIIQIIVLRLGWVLQKLLCTTPAESVNACASVFLGMTEAPIIIKPYLSTLTESEMHAVMMGGFSTVAGTVFAAYTSFGINPSYIITAAIMSAPTALSFSKLIFPETEEPCAKNQEITGLSNEKNGCNVVDAACRGAQFAVQMVSAIIANIIAFVSFVAFVNALLSWLGALVGFEEFNFEYILGKTLIPVAWVLGTEFDECETVAKLIGLKITTNEFIAYKQLGSLKTQHKLSAKSEIIATFALCSFANPGSMGSMIATLTTLAPSQQTSIVKNIFRAFVGGTVTTLLTAAIASLLMT